MTNDGNFDVIPLQENVSLKIHRTVWLKTLKNHGIFEVRVTCHTGVANRIEMKH